LNLAQKTVLRSKNFAFIVVYFVKMKTPCYKRGDDRGCFAFFARERGARGEQENPVPLLPTVGEGVRG